MSILKENIQNVVGQNQEFNMLTHFVQTQVENKAINFANKVGLKKTASSFQQYQQKHLVAALHNNYLFHNGNVGKEQEELDYTIDCVDHDDNPKPGTEEEKNLSRYLSEKRYGIHGNYIKCSNTVQTKLLTNINNNLEYRYTKMASFGGGKSGAYVFLVRDKFIANQNVSDADAKKKDINSLKVLKLYALEIFGMIQDRAKREIFTSCTLSGTIGCPKVFEYGTTYFKPESWLWKDFERAYIKCAGDNKWIFKSHQLYNQSYFIITSMSPGYTMDSSNINLFKLHPSEMFSILYQLTEI